MIRIACLAVSLAALSPWAAAAEEAYYYVPLGSLKSVEHMPQALPGKTPWRSGERVEALLPRAVLDGEGEVYVSLGSNFTFNRWQAPALSINAMNLAARAPAGKELQGTLYLPKPDWSGMHKLPFTLRPDQAHSEAKPDFEAAKRAHFQRLLAAGIPGAAWFRHQVRTASPDKTAPADAAQRDRRRKETLADAYALFSGGRAVSENLQLDRVLRLGDKPQEPTVDVDSLTGIKVPEIDWQARVKDLHPRLDPLAALVPADQHVLFFPSFSAAVAVADEADRQGTPILHLAEPRSVDELAQKTYQRQLGLSLTGLGRLLGPKLVKSVALTGSDPYYRVGTDVVVLFEAANAPLLENLLSAQIALGAKAVPEAAPQQGTAGKLGYRGFRSPDRQFCSYLARIGDAVAVTNSTAALERLAEVQAGQRASIASLPEYTFFRDRYRLGEANETGLLLVSDATIRRWCGPRWRIADVRRTRAMACLAEVEAANFRPIGLGQAQPGPVYTDLAADGLGELSMSRQGVRSADYGGLEFMTPIVELPLSKVTPAEAEAYRQWRETYERNWRWAFDPIALRMSLGKQKLAADLTVMPLIAGSDYRELLEISRGAAIQPGDADPHDALMQVVLAINPQSRIFQGYTSIPANLRQGMTFGWVGSTVSAYLDDDPFWEKAAAVPPEKMDEFWRDHAFEIPLGVRVASTDGLKLAAFLVSARAFAEQSAPGATGWLNHEHREHPYVQIRSAPGQPSVLGAKASVYYAALGDGLLLTPNESLLKRAIDRQIQREEANRGAAGQAAAVSTPGRLATCPTAWLGSSFAVATRQKILTALSVASREYYQSFMQRIAWSNLPILNEWKRFFPDQDPVEVHQRLWKVRLVCPGGGQYTWNPEWQTMQSTVYGHPGQPQPGPAAPPALEQFQAADFGLTFEDQGLRARVELQRGK